MNIRWKLLIFFTVILFILIVLRLVAGPNQNQASADEINVIDQKALQVTLTDSLDSTDVGNSSTYYLQIQNNSQQNLGTVRVYGYLGLPKNQSKISQSIFPDWLMPKNLQRYPDQNYFNYSIPMPVHSVASVNLPLKVQRLKNDQNTLYSRVFIQLGISRTSWNIFQINPALSGPIVASIEDTTTIN